MWVGSSGRDGAGTEARLTRIGQDDALMLPCLPTSGGVNEFNAFVYTFMECIRYPVEFELVNPYASRLPLARA